MIGDTTGTISEETRIDPERLFDEGDVDTDERTYTHETGDHCEADAVGRAVIGVTDADGSLLLVVDPAEGHALLPNETVASGEDWAAVGRERIAGMAGLEVALDGIVRVRRVEHVVEGEAERRTTHHVVFGASVDESRPPLDGLCDDNPWELRWCDDLPVEDDDGGTGSIDDVRLFLDSA